MTEEAKILSFLGIATKAGKTCSGDETVESAIKNEKAVLVIVAADASENTKNKFRSMCKYRNIKYAEFGTKELLGPRVGKDSRTVVGVIDKGFGNKLYEMIAGFENPIQN